MRFRFLIPFFLTALVFGGGIALAQSVRWDPPGGQLGLNQVSDLALVYDSCEPDSVPALPQIDGLTVLNPRNPSQSTQVNMVNMSVSRTFSYVFSVRPNKRATISIPAFEVATDKGRLRVPAASYTVGSSTVGGTGMSVDDVAKARLTTPEESYWAGEVIPINFTLDVVRRYFNQLASSVDWPSNQLVVEDWSKPDLREIALGGESHVISKQTTRAIARSPGTLALGPASQLVNLVVGSVGFGLFSQAQVEQRQIVSGPLEFTVKPLPPAPNDFSKAVGQFTLESKIVPTTTAVGEPVTWTLALSGTGNWPDIAGLPSREVSNDFQVVQPKSKRTMKDNALFEGTLDEDIVLVPTKPGTYRLGPVRFTYFDSKAGAYKTLSTEAATVTVTGAPGAAAPATQPQQQPAAGGPVQFTLPSTAATATAPVAPTAVPPAPPERLPRDPLLGAARGMAPAGTTLLVGTCAAAFAVPTLLVWLWLAIRRSRRTDPLRHRREARVQLASALARMHDGTPPDLLRAWQHHTSVLWEIGHAAPGPKLLHACVGRHAPDAADAWAKLWKESDRALHGPAAPLPADWLPRAEGALQAVRVPGWPVLSLFAPRNALPFLVGGAEPNAGALKAGIRVGTLSAALVLFSVMGLLAASVSAAEAPDAAYKSGNFADAEKGWRAAVADAPTDWAVRHNLGLSLAQQDRWGEAAAQWTSAFLLDPRADVTRWDLALGLQNAGFAPPELVEFSRGEGRYALARFASPGEWQLALVAASLLLALAAAGWLARAYRLCGSWAGPAAATGCVLALLLFVAATFSLKTYGVLANPAAVLVCKTSVLRSIPTEADTTQKTSALSAGSVALEDKTFLGWSRLVFPEGQTGWVRSEDLTRLYR